MEKITLIKCDDGSISVMADEGQINTKSTFNTITDENEQFMIALADFLGYEPAHLLDFEGLMDYFEDYYHENEEDIQEYSTLEFIGFGLDLQTDNDPSVLIAINGGLSDVQETYIREKFEEYLDDNDEFEMEDAMQTILDGMGMDYDILRYYNGKADRWIWF